MREDFLKPVFTSEFRKNQIIALNKMKQLSDGKANKICIFGAGQNGIKLYYYMRDRLIKVNYFSDNDSEKWGYFLQNIDCISPSNLLKEKDNILLVVSMKNPEKVIDQFRENGFKYVVRKEVIEECLVTLEPVKWIAELKNKENIDYSNEAVQTLLQEFNFVIYDLCQYYENKIAQLTEKQK